MDDDGYFSGPSWNYTECLSLSMMDCWFTITAVLPKLVDLPWWSSLVLLQRFLPKIDPLASSPAGSAVESYFGRERYDG